MSSLIQYLFYIALFLLFVWVPSYAHAYIGPGAGFAVISSFLIISITGVVAFFTILIWPFRAVLIMLRRRKIKKNRKARRVVVLGLDGLDPLLAKRFMDRGLLPQFRQLKNTGSFKDLHTTTPSVSPVAWSTFATGVNPGKHRIFDFYTRDPKNYLPVLSSARISNSSRHIKIGPIRIPINKTGVEFLRKSTSFWKLLGSNGIFCSVLRVPITYPPEKFYGTCLSAMCAPDLLGTQGTFTMFTTKANGPEGDDVVEKMIIPINLRSNQFYAEIKGPSIGTNGAGDLTLTFNGSVDAIHKQVSLNINKEHLALKEGEYSPWVRLEFKNGLRKKIRGIARFLVTEISPHLKIYMTPINIDPEKPALPVSHPLIYSISLSKLNGPFSTLGLSEDTWALNERVIDEDAFLVQTYDIYEDRKRHLFDSLKKNRDGLVVSVFDTSDRIQHMFFRYLDKEHPANRDKDTEKHKQVIEELYKRMDDLVGEVVQTLHKDDILLIISDHGFSQFKWGINLNTWLWQEGYLVLKEGVSPGRLWFSDVDWSRTRAYAYGLTGIFLNIIGREKEGVVGRGEDRLRLQLDLKEKLEALKDPGNDCNPIRRVILAQKCFNGPYVNDAPDLIIGYESGYRVSWNSAVGKITNDVFEANTKSWSGDHAIDPELVPGVFFSNRTIEDQYLSITDLAPTILELFGIKKHGFHDGKVIGLTTEGSRGQGFEGSSEMQENYKELKANDE
ncbi:MAG: nucleotide pyrophosphatase [Desulfobacterales bacterium]|nr:nucleotide pyrophosphatase [Desulfobacterales bacterium]